LFQCWGFFIGEMQGYGSIKALALFKC